MASIVLNIVKASKDRGKSLNYEYATMSFHLGKHIYTTGTMKQPQRGFIAHKQVTVMQTCIPPVL